MNETSPHKDDLRLTEALFRFGAALPACDDFEQDLYRPWHARDARRPGFTTYGCSPHLHGLTDDHCANSPKPTCKPKPNALPNFANPSQNRNVSLSGNLNQSQKQILK